MRLVRCCRSAVQCTASRQGSACGAQLRQQCTRRTPGGSAVRGLHCCGSGAAVHSWPRPGAFWALLLKSCENPNSSAAGARACSRPSSCGASRWLMPSRVMGETRRSRETSDAVRSRALLDKCYCGRARGSSGEQAGSLRARPRVPSAGRVSRSTEREREREREGQTTEGGGPGGGCLGACREEGCTQDR